MTIVAVIGSRTMGNYDLIRRALDDLKPASIISGGAVGVDSMAEQYAKNEGIPFTAIRPEYAKYGRGAPLFRNERIVDSADKVVAFWDGKSRGTKHAIDYAVAQKKDLEVVVVG